jgi:hypothetical protein
MFGSGRIAIPLRWQAKLPAIDNCTVAANLHSILVTSDMLLMTLKSCLLLALTISAIALGVTYAATCLALPSLRQRRTPGSFRLQAESL